MDANFVDANFADTFFFGGMVVRETLMGYKDGDQRKVCAERKGRKKVMIVCWVLCFSILLRAFVFYHDEVNTLFLYSHSATMY